MRKTLACKKCGELCQVAEDAVAVICWRCTMKMCIAEEKAQKSRRVDIGELQDAIRGGRLKRYRKKELGLTLEQLAKTLGVSKHYLQKIENRRVVPSERWIRQLSGKVK